DSHGQKMSKSKGNVLDPLDLIDGIDLETLVKKRTTGLMQPQMAPKIEKLTRKDFPDGIPAFGTDALRFTFAAMASTGRDINFDLPRVEGYRNFCNKLWNAARYVLMNTEGQDCGQDNDDVVLSAADLWIISRFQQTAKTVMDTVKQYRMDLASQAIYEFTWNEYCDWYLELSKPVLNNADSSAEALRGTRRTLVRVLDALLRLAHPFMPYITEEIWQKVAPLAGAQGETIMSQNFPVPEDDKVDQQATAEIEWVKQFILGIRQIRGEMNINPGKAVPVLIQNGSDSDQQLLTKHEQYIQFLGKTESITWLNSGDEAPEASTCLVGNMKVLIPLAGLIDKEAEAARLSKDLEKRQKELDGLDRQLSNANFVDKARPEVVDKVKQRRAETAAAIENLQEQLKRIKSL
ncbi:MAG: valine--tRNA ligase, partial [Gammaproteobacteria bacterium SG8_11]